MSEEDRERFGMRKQKTDNFQKEQEPVEQEHNFIEEIDVWSVIHNRLLDAGLDVDSVRCYVSTYIQDSLGNK